jgi:phosphohistidine phosphatase SixA
MLIVLARHGARVHKKDVADPHSPLTAAGEKQAAELAELLDNRGIHCSVFLSSNYAHALQTARILADRNPGAAIHELCAFTPHSARETLEEMVTETSRARLDLSKLDVITFVGHEPRIGQLYARLTSESIPQLGNCEAVGVSGTWDDFLNHRGKMEFRTRMPTSGSDALAEKVHRKMEVSVFLGAVTIPALVEVVKSDTATMSLTRGVSAFFLTLALALYIAAVYIYDELSMPDRFWSAAKAARRRGLRSRTFQDNLAQGGPVFAHMIHAWTHIFTPAVFCSVAGFLALFWDIHFELERWQIGVACIGAIAVGYGFYWLARPRLAVD